MPFEPPLTGPQKTRDFGGRVNGSCGVGPHPGLSLLGEVERGHGTRPEGPQHLVAVAEGHGGAKESGVRPERPTLLEN
jgi:hypothetical protein